MFIANAVVDASMTVAEAWKEANKKYGTKLSEGTTQDIISQDSARRASKNPIPPLMGRPPLRAPDIVPDIPPHKELTARRSARLQRDENGADAVVLSEQQRCAIFVVFAQVLYAPHRSEWQGVNGTIAIIMKVLNMPSGSRDVVARVLEHGSKCIDDGIPYCADRKLQPSDDSRTCIQRFSPEEQIVADCIEKGGSHRIAAAQVNDYRRPLGLPHIGVSSVSTWCQRMHSLGMAKTSRIKTIKQGI